MGECTPFDKINVSASRHVNKNQERCAETNLLKKFHFFHVTDKKKVKMLLCYHFNFKFVINFSKMTACRTE